MSGRFELYKDVRGRFRFRLKSDIGEEILASDGYEQKAFALDAIVSVMKNAPEAILIDQTPADSEEISYDDAPLLFEDEEQYEVIDFDEPSVREKKKRAKKGKKAKKDKKSKHGKKRNKRKSKRQ